MLCRQTQSQVLAIRTAAIRAFGCYWGTLVNTSNHGRRSIVTRPFRPWRRRQGLGSRLGQSVYERSLATAVNDFNFDVPSYDHSSDHTLPPYVSPSLRSHDFRSFDPSLPLTIPEPGPPKAPTKINLYGVPGETEDMLPVFDACVRVGKLERAALVLRRFNAMAMLSGEERILLHNQYLRASLLQMRNSPDRKQAEQLHRWYELQIRSTGLPHTAETVACMLKASLLSERGSRLARLIRRYMGMAPGESGLRVLSMADILSDSDLAVITDICPTYNFTVEDDNLVDPSEICETESRPQKTEVFVGDAADHAFQDLPDLIETPQRGEGLATLKRGLRLLTELQDVDITKMSYEDRREIQVQLERDAIGSAVHKWRTLHKAMQKMGINTALTPSTHPGSLSQHMSRWLVSMEQRLKEELVLIQNSESKATKSESDLERCIYGPLIQQADPARLAAITIISVLSLGAAQGVDKGIVVSRLISNIAKFTQEDIDMQRGVKRRQIRSRANISYIELSTISANNDQQPDDEIRPHTTLITESPETIQGLEEKTRVPWSMSIKAQVGSILLKLFIETAKINVTTRHSVSEEEISQFQPAFTHMQQPRKGKKVGVLYLNPVLLEQVKREPVGDLLAKHLPMVVEPKPWRCINEGGFLESKTAFVRARPGDVEQKLYTEAAIKSGDLKQICKGLDVLGKTAWQINNNVLTVMMEAWNTGEEIANIPPLDPRLEVPPEPDASADPLLHKTWIRAVKAVENERSGLHSQRCFMNLQLEIARTFRNQTIYFPHNIDYRGRAYPMPTYLNHMGADHARAVLSFARGKELGIRGLRWLKIHLANLYGLDKSSFDEREKFANDNVANIIDSATNPLNGSRWWLKAEEPWQCLAACFEMKAALDLPDPTRFKSQLPIQQDGTCNGLQHYAALGGDAWGARQVNLEPADRPADVYSAVANLVKEAIDEDAKAQVKAAEVLQGKITRKVVKQTVMTNVYGVTFAGAKKQVCKQIDALYPDMGKECGIPNIVLSTYIARHIFKALQSMFSGAHDIQYWLGDIGNRVCRALTAAQLQQMADGFAAPPVGEGGRRKRAKKAATGECDFDALTKQFRSSVVWTSPLRLPVVQPYRKNVLKEIRTCLQAVVFPVPDQTDAVNRRKQLQGFPPNFIHSLDASHMLLSALQCNDRGLDFAAVHDSFWTHACDVDTMNEVLREAFIQIHEEDVVGRLAKEFEVRHKGSLYLSYIEPQSAVAKKIRELRKKSKLSPKEELLLEHKRNSLRLSGNPWDLEAAKQIVTPASVYEDMCGESAEIKAQDDIAGIALGEIPQSDDADADVHPTLTTGADEMTLVADEYGSETNDEEDDLVALSQRDVSDMGTTNHFEVQMVGNKKEKKDKKTANKTKSGRSAPVPVWLPLTIPDVPKKGEFDVTRLRESKYFFS